MRQRFPLLTAAEVLGFVGYREPQASRPGDWVIMDHYRRVAARLRDPRPLEWLDLASSPMEIAVRD